MDACNAARSGLRQWFEHLACRLSFGPIRLGALATLDPDHFSAQDAAAVLSTSERAARRICNIAVRRGEFLRRVEPGPGGEIEVFSLAPAARRTEK